MTITASEKREWAGYYQAPLRLILIPCGRGYEIPLEEWREEEVGGVAAGIGSWGMI